MKKTHLFFASLVLFSCKEETKNSEPQPSTSPAFGVEISTLVPDLSTSVGNQPVGILLRSTSEDFMKRIGVQLENELELRTYPELEIVPTTRMTTISYRPREGIPYEGKISLNHPIPLEDRWYVVILKNIPANQQGWIQKKTSNLVGQSVSQLGVMVARFHPASQPMIRQITYCAPTTMIVKFSEKLAFSGPEIDGEMPMFFQVGDHTCKSNQRGGDGLVEDFSFMCPYSKDEPETNGISFELKQNKFGINWLNVTAKTSEDVLKQQISINIQKKDLVADIAEGDRCWAYVP
jgi:hypothetical protein